MNVMRWLLSALGPWRRHYQPDTPRDSIDAVLYTRAGCHLCEVARETLRRHGVLTVEVDIDQHPPWQVRYHDCVPVVWIQGRERFRGKVDERLLRRLLRGIRRK